MDATHPEQQPPQPAEPADLNHWPLLAVLICLGAGLAVIAGSHWRRGSLIVGGAVALAGLIRLFLPKRIAGLLAVRRRWFDVTLYLLAATGIIILAFVVPPSQPVE